MQEGIDATALGRELRVHCVIAPLQPIVVLRVFAYQRDELYLECGEHCAVTSALPGLQPATTQFVT